MVQLSTKRAFFLLIFPAAFLFVVYVIIPVGVAFEYSLTNYQGLGEKVYTGLRNYQVLIGNRYFHTAILNNLQIMLFNMLFVIPVAFTVAMMINREFKGTNFFKTVFFTPGVISGIIAGLIWAFILDPHIGVINSLLRAAGLGRFAPEWIGGKNLTPLSVSLVGTWQGLGFNMLLILSGLNMIPNEIYEAAEVDGASRRQRMWLITIPNLKETFVTCLVLMITGSLKTFETVMMLTGGGPSHVSETMVSLMYNQTFISHKYGYGMAMAVVEFAIALTLSIIVLRVTNKRVDE